jgi:hypothetical protein
MTNVLGLYAVDLNYGWQIKEECYDFCELCACENTSSFMLSFTFSTVVVEVELVLHYCCCYCYWWTDIKIDNSFITCPIIILILFKIIH